MLEELIAFNYCEVLIKLLHGDDLGKLGFNSYLIKLCLAQLLLEVFILQFKFLSVFSLLSVFFIAKAQVISEVIDYLQKLLFVFSPGTTSAPFFALWLS